MLAVTRHRPPDVAAFVIEAGSAIAVLADRPGCLSAKVVRAIDDADLVLVVTEWQDVGSYRRALSSFDVKVRAVPLLATAADEPSAFETVAEMRSGELLTSPGDLAPDADTAGPR